MTQAEPHDTPSARLWAVLLTVALGVTTVVSVVALFGDAATRDVVLGLHNIALTPVWIGLTILGVRVNKPERPLPWLVFGIGAGAANVAGTVLQAITFARSGAAALELPGLYLYCFLSAYVFIIAFLVMVVRARSPRGKEGAIILDTLTMACAVGLLMWLYILNPSINDTMTFSARFITIGFPVCDLIVLWLTLRLAMGAGVRSVAFWSFIVSEALTIVANAYYGWTDLHGGTGQYAWIGLNFVWYGSATLMFAAPLHPTMRSVMTRATDSEPLDGRWRLFFVAGAALVGPLLLIVHRDSTTVIAVGCAIMFLLVVIRLEGLLRTQAATNRALDDSLRRLRQADVQLRHAQKLESVGRLAAGVAHELNTPMQFIGDNVRFLSDSYADVARLAHGYRQLLTAVDDDGTIVRRLSDIEAGVDIEYLDNDVPHAIAQTIDGVERVTHIVAAMKAFGYQPNDDQVSTDINAAIGNTIAVASNELRDTTHVELNLGDIPNVVCFPADINQVLLNLVINASEANNRAVRGTAERCTLRVRTSRDGDHVVIAVEDTGVGIPADAIGRIFDPFFTTKTVGDGTGQGLSLVWSLVVDRHNGSIDVESEPGRGATFVVRLPVNGASPSNTSPSNTVARSR